MQALFRRTSRRLNAGTPASRFKSGRIEISPPHFTRKFNSRKPKKLLLAARLPFSYNQFQPA
jgi:hypothetical protein